MCETMPHVSSPGCENATPDGGVREDRAGAYIYHTIVINVLVQTGVLGLTGLWMTALTTAGLAGASWVLIAEPTLARRKVSLYQW
jgi:hypothetical protein